jgi:AcrR family transcriptional regulator
MSTSEKRRKDPDKAADRRRQVLDAAAACFGRSGFHGASMSEISKAAGMSAGHIYNYFDGKDAIIAAFVEDNVARVFELLADLGEQPDILQAMLDDLPRSIKENMGREAWALQFEISAEATRNPAIAAVVTDADRRTRTHFRAILSAGRVQHGLAVDEATIEGRSETIIALIQGLHARALYNPGLDEACILDSYLVVIRGLLYG